MEIKPFLAVLFCGALILFLCACSREPGPSPEETTDWTVPTLDQSQTPNQLLTAAAQKTRSLEAFAVDYVRNMGEDRFALSGQVRSDEGGYRAETLTCSFTPDGTTTDEVSRYYQGNLCWEQLPEGVEKTEVDAPYDLSQILAPIAEFQNREDLIDTFSNLPIHAVPSYDGSFCFQIRELTWDEFSPLLYGVATEYREEGAFSVTLTVAPEGHLSQLEFTGDTLQLTLTLRPLEEDEQVTPPEWVPEN